MIRCVRIVLIVLAVLAAAGCLLVVGSKFTSQPSARAAGGYEPTARLPGLHQVHHLSVTEEDGALKGSLQLGTNNRHFDALYSLEAVECDRRGVLFKVRELPEQPCCHNGKPHVWAWAYLKIVSPTQAEWYWLPPPAGGQPRFNDTGDLVPAARLVRCRATK